VAAVTRTWALVPTFDIGQRVTHVDPSEEPPAPAAAKTLRIAGIVILTVIAGLIGIWVVVKVMEGLFVMMFWIDPFDKPVRPVGPPPGPVAPTLPPSFAVADGSLRGEYFVVSSKHPDVNHGTDGTIVRGLFENRLGPDGFPVVSSFGRTYTGGSGKIVDTNAAGEVMWYSTHDTRGSRREKVVPADRLPFTFDNFYPDGKHGDDNGFRFVHWSGVFTLRKAQSIGLSLGSDDDSWVFIDRTLVDDNGGVKALAYAPLTSTTLAAGPHELDVFYADRCGSAAQLHLSTDFPVEPPPQARPAGE
jgi:fibro-slime domain-containing protein